ncbi:MAG: glycosyltransferase [Candidatus Bathyarchaeota archaeon]|nr:glycosyltransferase [Candidatus Bathyarchaeota archaeon]
MPTYLSVLGCGVNERKLMRDLANKESVRVITLTREVPSERLADLLDSQSVNTIELPFGRFSKPAFVFDFVWSLLLSATFIPYRLIGNRAFDVIYVRGASEAVGFISMQWLHGIPVVFKLMSYRSDEYKTENPRLTRRIICKILLILDQIAIHTSEKVIVPSVSFKKDLMAQHRISTDKISVLRVGASISHFLSAKPSVIKDNSTFTLGYFGSLLEFNDVACLLKALKLLKNKIPFKLILSTKANLQQAHRMVNEYGLKDNVTVTSTPFELVPQLMANIDVIMIPRRKLSSTDLVIPLKLIEAGAASKPVIIAKTEIIGVELTDKKQVLMYEPSNVEDLTDKIFQLYNDKALRSSLGNHLFDYAKEFDWSNISVALRNILCA